MKRSGKQLQATETKKKKKDKVVSSSALKSQTKPVVSNDALLPSQTKPVVSSEALQTLEPLTVVSNEAMQPSQVIPISVSSFIGIFENSTLSECIRNEISEFIEKDGNIIKFRWTPGDSKSWSFLMGNFMLFLTELIEKSKSGNLPFVFQDDGKEVPQSVLIRTFLFDKQDETLVCLVKFLESEAQ